MNDKFSLYQTEGLWGIIENASDEKQTSIKSYFGSDLLIKRLNEQADQIDQLKQQLAEKDKEIERLNTIIGLSQLQVSEKDRLNTSVNINSLQYNQTQLAIQELEKVKMLIEWKFNSIIEVREYLQQQIKELKGGRRC